MKRVLTAIASIFVGLIAMFTAFFLTIWVAVAALILGRKIRKQAEKEAAERGQVIEGDYDVVHK